MDCASFFTERVQHFDEERKIFGKYKLLVSPLKSELHQLSFDTLQQQESSENAVQEVNKVISELTLAQKELQFKRDELIDLKEHQIARKQQILRLSQLSQPIESDVTYLFNERNINLNKNHIESLPNNNKLINNSFVKQTKSGDLIQLEIKLHEITKLTHTKFSNFDSEFVNANIISYKCEKEVIEKVRSAIIEAKELIINMNEINSQSFFSVKELLYLRLKILITQRMEIEELECLNKEKEYFISKENELKEQLISEMQQMKSRLKHGIMNI